MRSRDAGIVLVNVLVVIALGSAIVVLMFNAQENVLSRAQAATALARAEAIALGAEDSVRLALRRDMAEAPETDHLAEDWAAVMQEEVTLAIGRFSVAVTDAQARFDLNGIGAAGLVQQTALLRVLALAGLSETLAPALVREVTQRGPFHDLQEINALDERSRAALAPHIVLLPQAGGLNLNTAAPDLMAAVLGNVGAARQLAARRSQAGFLVRGDLSDAGLAAVTGAGLTSDAFDATVTVEVDDVVLVMQSRLVRIRTPGRQDVIVTRRTFGAPVPSGDL